jgi:hypothetical protein
MVYTYQQFKDSMFGRPAAERAFGRASPLRGVRFRFPLGAVIGYEWEAKGKEPLSHGAPQAPETNEAHRGFRYLSSPPPRRGAKSRNPSARG